MVYLTQKGKKLNSTGCNWRAVTSNLGHKWVKEEGLKCHKKRPAKVSKKGKGSGKNSQSQQGH